MLSNLTNGVIRLRFILVIKLLPSTLDDG